MRIIEKIINLIFSLEVLIISILSCLLVFGWLKIAMITNIIQAIVNNNKITISILIVSILLILLAIRNIFFNANSKKEEFKTGILLENEDGKLLISKDTIENLVNSVVKGFEGIGDTQSKVILDQQNNVTILITLLIKEGVIIKDLSSKIQTKVKETIKRTSDLEVKQINIKIKNIDLSKKVEIVKKVDPINK